MKEINRPTFRRWLASDGRLCYLILVGEQWRSLVVSRELLSDGVFARPYIAREIRRLRAKR